MKIMTWNIQNGGAIWGKNGNNSPCPSNIQNVLNVIEERNPDILVLQEFQYQYWEGLVEHGLKKIGYTYFKYRKDLEDYTARNGVMICTKHLEMCLKDKPNKIDRYSSRNWLEANFLSVDLVMLAIDVPLLEKPNSFTKRDYIRKIDGREYDCEKREKFLKVLKDKFNEFRELKKPAVILGDFNLYDSLQCSYNEYMIEYKKTLISMVNAITYGDHQNDYIFGNKLFEATFKPLQFDKDNSIECSDHKAVSVIECETRNNEDAE